MPLQPVVDDFAVFGGGIQTYDCFRTNILDAFVAFLHDAQPNAPARFAFGVYFHDLHSLGFGLSAAQRQAGGGGDGETEVFGQVSTSP